MIIVQLKGGLGNQMFQYAAARRLALKNKTLLKLDVTLLHRSNSTHEIFALNNYKIDADMAEESDIKNLYANTFFQKLLRKIKKITGILKIREIDEKQGFVFDPEILNLSDNIFLCGYWQSEKYFIDIKNTIINEFLLKGNLTQKSAIVVEQIKSMKNTVSLHIRRGDYANDACVNSIFGLCSFDYYRNCLEVLNDTLGNLNVFIFSDTPEWVKENIICLSPPPPRSAQFYIVDHNGIEFAHEDLYLMSICEHNIVANSSFSWWGAYLNQNRQKIVLAPQKWLNQGIAPDILPETWVKI